MTDHALVAHRGSQAPAGVRGIAALVELKGSNLLFEYRLTGNLLQVAIPHGSRPQRTDRLWEHTCFEAFVAPAGGSRYFELNFSPSTQWAAYEFDGYRQGMRPLTLGAAPAIAVATTADELRVTAAVELGTLADAPWPWRIGLTAVVEDRAGVRGYFALRHPRDKPDFHDSAAFTALLEEGTR